MPKPTREEQSEYQREWMRQRRDGWIKANGPCAHCGSWDDLEVDHVDPATKTYPPAGIWSRRAEIRDAELAKCQVLCYRCHKVKTVAAYPEVLHGTPRRYRLGCRCGPCRLAQSERGRDYRRRKGAANGDVASG